MAFFSGKMGVGVLHCALCALPLYLNAQNTGTATLQQIVQAAGSHLPLLAEKKALISSAAAETQFVKHSFLPAAILADEVSVNSDNSSPGSYWSLGIIPSTSGGIRSANNYQAATGNIGVLYGQYDLEDFGLKKAAIDNAKANQDLSESDLQRETYMLTWQISRLYFNLVKYQYQAAVDSQNVKRYEGVYQVIKAVTRSGIKPGADSSLALAELSKARISYNQSQSQVRQIQQQLSFLSGIPAQKLQPPVNNDYADTIGNVAQAAIAGMGNYNDSAHSTANPLMDYYNRQKMLYQSTEMLIRKSYLPKIFLAGDVWVRGSSIDYNNAYKSLVTGLGYQRVNYMAGVTISYDLFSGVHKKDRLDAAKFKTQAATDALQQQQLELQNTSNKADEAISTAWTNLQEIPVQINAAQSSYAQKTAQYKAGIINLVDLTNAFFVLYRAQTDYVQTLSDWYLANLDKSAATGTLELFIQTIK